MRYRKPFEQPEQPSMGEPNGRHAGLSPSEYVAAQGTAMLRAGRVYLRRSGNDVWVGGDVVDCIKGEVDF